MNVLAAEAVSLLSFHSVLRGGLVALGYGRREGGGGDYGKLAVEAWGRREPARNLPGDKLEVIQKSITSHTAVVETLTVGRNLPASPIVLPAPPDFLLEVAEVLLHLNVILQWTGGLEEREVPHCVRNLAGLHLEYHGTQPHHEAVPTGCAVAVYVEEVLVPRLHVNRSEELFSPVKGQGGLPEEGHGLVVNLLVPHIPAYDRCVEEGHVLPRSPPALLRIILPRVGEVGRLESLVIVNGRTSTRCRSPKERCVDLLLPCALKLPKVCLGEEIPRFTLKRDLIRHGVSLVVECITENLAASALPVL
mmetsp:Transcript_12624/g.25748  ORF Transcript_12624/g.25748 Transcript_12624/m.25748 type:complete len:306 (+) Transcript_12624:177-1094(+)